MIETYEQAVAYVKDFIPFTLYNTDAYKKTDTHDPLDRMRYFLKLLDNPEKKFQSVLIGGTSGKGSTSYLLSHVLTQAGYKTGLTLSPHIVSINERIQINEKNISNEAFTKLVKSVRPFVEEMKNSPFGSPSYFEITVGMAFLFFAQSSVDIAVVEVGMGGEYDATNTLEPLVAILTNVSLDHTQFLGDTVEKIAETKVGIIKNYELGITNYELKQKIYAPIFITGVTQPPVIGIVEKQAAKVGTTVFRLGKDFALTNLEIGLSGEYQKENASLAIEAIKKLKQFGFTVSDEVMKYALKTAHFPGRFELIEYVIHNTTYKILLDGAHNPAKMRAFVTSLQKAYPENKKIFVIAFKKDKNIKDMLMKILPVADMLVITEFEIGTDTMIANASMDAEEIIAIIKKIHSSSKRSRVLDDTLRSEPRSSRQARTIKDFVFIEKNSSKAVEKALSLCHPEQTLPAGRQGEGSHSDSSATPSDRGFRPRPQNDSDCIIAVTGSLYLVGELKQRYFRGGQ